MHFSLDKMIDLLNTYDDRSFCEEFSAVEVGIDELMNVIRRTGPNPILHEICGYNKCFHYYNYFYVYITSISTSAVQAEKARKSPPSARVAGLKSYLAPNSINIPFYIFSFLCFFILNNLCYCSWKFNWQKQINFTSKVKVVLCLASLKYRNASFQMSFTLTKREDDQI